MKLKKRINWKEILFYISFFGCIYFSVLFWAGFHNLDLGHNLRVLEASGNSLKDMDINGIIRTPTELYRLGLNQMRNAFFGLISFLILFGYAIKNVNI